MMSDSELLYSGGGAAGHVVLGGGELSLHHEADRRCVCVCVFVRLAAYAAVYCRE